MKYAAKWPVLIVEAAVDGEDLFCRRAIVGQRHGMYAVHEGGGVKEFGGGTSGGLNAARLKVDDPHRLATLLLADDGLPQTQLPRREAHGDQCPRFGLHQQGVLTK